MVKDQFKQSKQLTVAAFLSQLSDGDLECNYYISRLFDGEETKGELTTELLGLMKGEFSVDVACCPGQSLQYVLRLSDNEQNKQSVISTLLFLQNSTDDDLLSSMITINLYYPELKQQKKLLSDFRKK